MKEERVWRRVWTTRWFAGFATAVLLIGVAAMAGLVFGGLGPTQAATDAGSPLSIRMTIPGVTDTVPGKQEWVELESFSIQVEGVAGAPGGGSGVVGVSDAVIVKEMDRSTHTLFNQCCLGDTFPEVWIEFCHRSGCGDKHKYLELRLESVQVASYQVSGSGGSDSLPMETVTLNYKKIDWTYQKLDPKTGKPTTDAQRWTLDCEGTYPTCEKRGG